MFGEDFDFGEGGACTGDGMDAADFSLEFDEVDRAVRAEVKPHGSGEVFGDGFDLEAVGLDGRWGGAEKIFFQLGEHDGVQTFVLRVDAVGDEAEEFGLVCFEDFFPIEVVADDAEVEFFGEIGVGLVVIVDARAGGGTVDFTGGNIGDDIHRLQDDFDLWVFFEQGGNDGAEVGEGFFDGDVVGLVGVVDSEFDEDDIGFAFDDVGEHVEAAVPWWMGGGTGSTTVIGEGGLAGVVGLKPLHHGGGPSPSAAGEGGAHGGDADFIAVIELLDEGGGSRDQVRGKEEGKEEKNEAERCHGWVFCGVCCPGELSARELTFDSLNLFIIGRRGKIQVMMSLTTRLGSTPVILWSSPRY